MQWLGLAVLYVVVIYAGILLIGLIGALCVLKFIVIPTFKSIMEELG